MEIYNQQSMAFISLLKKMARQLIIQEMGLMMGRERVHFQGYTYSLKFVVFEGQSQLGFFNHQLYVIGINSELMHMGESEFVLDVLRHELAHFYTHLLYGQVQSHGEAFRSVCDRLGWAHAAKAQVAWPSIPAHNTSGEKIVQKVQKLLQLATSSNQHESQLAMARANELMIRYNLESISEEKSENFECYVLKIFECKRKNAKAQVIYDIVEKFFVTPVFSHGTDLCYLEVVGERANVLLAQYIAQFLKREVDLLWWSAKKSNPTLKGTAAKNSFFRGIALGYVEKLEQLQVKSITKTQFGLIKMKNAQLVDMAYGSRLRSSVATRALAQHREALGLGKKAGMAMNIQRPIEHQERRGQRRLLSWQIS